MTERERQRPMAWKAAQSEGMMTKGRTIKARVPAASACCWLAALFYPRKAWTGMQQAWQVTGDVRCRRGGVAPLMQTILNHETSSLCSCPSASSSL